jgi:hypothetical protein
MWSIRKDTAVNNFDVEVRVPLFIEETNTNMGLGARCQVKQVGQQL